MVTGMWMPVWPLRLLFFRLSASSGFSTTGSSSEGDCKGLVADPSASVSEYLSLKCKLNLIFLHHTDLSSTRKKLKDLRWGSYI